MTASAIAEISRRQLADYDAHRPGRIFEDPCFRLSFDEAYAVQIQTAALRTARGEAIGGYKVGCLSEPIQRQLNVDQPVFGHLFDTEFFRSGAVLDPAAFDCLAIEGELAVRVAEDIPDASRLPTDPTRLIASAFVVIELHNHVFRAATRTAQELIANNTFHAGVILPSLEFPLRNTLESLPGRSRCSAMANCWEWRLATRFRAGAWGRCSALSSKRSFSAVDSERARFC